MPQAEMMEIVQAAAAWSARLNAEDCSDDERTRHEAWMAEDPSHREIFVLMTGVWSASSQLGSSRRVTRRSMIATLVATAALGVPLRGADAAVWRTGTGERKRMNATPSVSALLDTATCGILAPDRSTLHLIDGQLALDASERFIVRTDIGEVSLHSGQINVRMLDGALETTVLRRSVLAQGRGWSVSLREGQRLMWSKGRRPVLDQPDLRDLEAWREGCVVFREATLAAAIAEMNRYSTRHLLLRSHGLATLRISGRYRVGDIRHFARALTAIFPVRVLENAAEISIVTVG